jgi:hypothetical protein
MLQAYPASDLELVGIDPTGAQFAHLYPKHIKLIPDYFSAGIFHQKFPRKKAKIVTSIAMFYDLENPQAFMSEIHSVLAPDGIWGFEQAYLPFMLESNAYDTICHEHISYYSLKQIKWMTDRCGFKILDVELNDVNGGSFCVTVAKDTASFRANESLVERLLDEEEKAGVNSLNGFIEFRENVVRHRERLREFVRRENLANRRIYGYGASTKGNVILQFCGFSADDIPAIAEVNEQKFGAYTPKTHIPIRSENEIRDLKPDYLLVLPWHFREGIIRREWAYLQNGGRLLFPLPRIEVVSLDSFHRCRIEIF